MKIKKNQKIFLQTDFDVPMMWGEWILRRNKDGVVRAAGKAARTCPSFWVRFSVSETGRACRFTGFSASAFLLLLSVFPRVHQALLQLGLQVLLLYCCRQRLTLEVHELHVHQRGVRKSYLRNLSFRNNTLQQTCAQFLVSHDDSKHERIGEIEGNIFKSVVF